MTLDEGASLEIISRWAEYRQRNCALDRHMYGEQYYKNMMCGIKLVRDHHNDLKERGDTIWSIHPELTFLLDQLAQKIPGAGYSPPPTK